MIHYRDSYQIIKEILESLPEAKTRIMYRVMLSWELTNRYLDRLLNGGLIEYLHNRYFITKKGEEYLRMLNMLLVLQQK